MLVELRQGRAPTETKVTIHKPAEGICGRASATEAMSIRKESKNYDVKRPGHWLQPYADECPQTDRSREGRCFGSPNSVALARGQ